MNYIGVPGGPMTFAFNANEDMADEAIIYARNMHEALWLWNQSHEHEPWSLRLMGDNE